MEVWQSIGVVAGALLALGSLGRMLVTWFVRGTETILERHLAPIHNELTRNGGESLKDAVVRIERKVDNHIEGHAA